MNNTIAIKQKPKILYVDDEKASLTGFKSVFRDNYNVFTASSAKEGYKIMKNNNISIVISDQRMPEETGVEFLQKIKVEFPETVRMMITGYSDINAVINAINKSMVYYYFAKPYEAEDMKLILNNAIETLELSRQNKELLDRLSAMVKQLKETKKELEKEVIQRKEAELEVRKLNNELLTLDKAKVDFLRIISHEIRTPLNGIIGPIELLKDQIKDADLSKILSILDRSVLRLEKFSNIALIITGLQTKTYDLTFEEISINKTIDEILSSFTETSANKNIRFQKTISHENLTLKFDKTLFELCFYNLIENAIKYSPESGKIKITIVKHDQEAIIQITDNGEGFPENILKNYQKFFNTGETHINDNIGVNIALSKLIIDTHRGKLSLTNLKEKGAMIKITLPAS